VRLPVAPDLAEQVGEVVLVRRPIPLVPRLFLMVDSRGVLDDGLIEVIGSSFHKAQLLQRERQRVMEAAAEGVSHPLVEDVRVVPQDSEGVVVAAREELYGREPQQGFRTPRRFLDNLKGAGQEQARLVVRTFSPVAECEFTARGGGPLRLPERFKT
jgi:hypothetical protein